MVKVNRTIPSVLNRIIEFHYIGPLPLFCVMTYWLHSHLYPSSPPEVCDGLQWETHTSGHHGIPIVSSLDEPSTGN